MKKEYQKHIVSTLEYQVWLHRTSKDNVDNIMRNGLNFGYDLSGTATLQQRDLQTAEGIYTAGKDFGKAAIVIKIPEKIVKRHYRASEGMKGPGHEGYKTDKDVTYYNEGFNIQRQHIHGWIDRELNEYHPNPYLNEPQQLTEKHFPKEFYGGLEKDLIEPEQPIKNTKKKQPKSRTLPSPPEEIRI
jgi:hypothetical protein